MSQCLPLNGASVLQPSVYKAAILPWTMSHTGKSRRIRQELCSSWGLLKMRIQSHKFLEKLSLSVPLTALIFKICSCWYTFTSSRLAANCLCQWASHIHCWPLSPAHCDQLLLTPFSKEDFTSHFSISCILLSPHRLFSPVPFLVFPGYSTPLPTIVAESRVTIPDPLQASPGPGAAQKLCEGCRDYLVIKKSQQSLLQISSQVWVLRKELKGRKYLEDFISLL